MLFSFRSLVSFMPAFFIASSENTSKPQSDHERPVATLSVCVFGGTQIILKTKVLIQKGIVSRMGPGGVSADYIRFFVSDDGELPARYWSEPELLTSELEWRIDFFPLRRHRQACRSYGN
jgi:hypothetical protein